LKIEKKAKRKKNNFFTRSETILGKSTIFLKSALSFFFQKTNIYFPFLKKRNSDIVQYKKKFLLLLLCEADVRTPTGPLCGAVRFAPPLHPPGLCPVHYSASPLLRFSTLPLRGRMDG
jgi:hypothetical protein